TCKSVSKQTISSPFRINTYEKQAGGGGRLASALFIPPICAVLQTLALDQEYKPMGGRKKGHCSMTKRTGSHFTVREDPMAAISRRGFAIHLSAETRPWLCPSGVFACKALLIGSELPHFLAPAVLLFPIHAGPPAAGLSA